MLPVASFTKLFWYILRCSQRIALSFNSRNASNGVNYAQKSFMKLATIVNFINIFWHLLCSYRHNLNHNLRPYAESGINYTKKGFMKLATVTNTVLG